MPHFCMDEVMALAASIAGIKALVLAWRMRRAARRAP